jgi:hypothetical protein
MVVVLNNQPTTASESPWAMSEVENHYNLSWIMNLWTPLAWPLPWVSLQVGFTPATKAEPDIWMQHDGDYYEYIAVYVDTGILAPQG